jgi:enoyl-CoA hydratase/carnithine racemase
MNGFHTIDFDKRDGVAWVTLNRPDVLNAINGQMRDELWAALEAVALDPDVAVAVFRGAGDRAFSSGADLTEFGSAPSYFQSRQARHERDLWRLILSAEKPLIAAIQGYALGAGCELSLCCDFRIAAEDAVIGLPETGLGYLPAAGGTQTLSRTVGLSHALHLILSAKPVSGREAFEMGFVQWVVPRAEVDAVAATLAARLRDRPLDAIRLTKRAIVDGLNLSLVQGLDLEARLRRRIPIA